MSNRRELAAARREAERAQITLELIEALPRRVGSFYEWRNGVRWERIGDNAWWPWHRDDSGEWERGDPEVFRAYPSDHVATHAESLLPARILAGRSA